MRSMERRVDFMTFRQLLQSLENCDTAIRLRISGEAWTDFSALILLSENAMILQDGSEGRLVINLRNVVQFELAEPHLDLIAYNVYEITH